MKKSSIAVITGFTMLFGSNPRLNAKKFKNVEQGIEIVKVREIETTGITINKPR